MSTDWIRWDVRISGIAEGKEFDLSGSVVSTSITGAIQKTVSRTKYKHPTAEITSLSATVAKEQDGISEPYLFTLE